MTVTLDGRDELTVPLLRTIRTAIDVGDGGSDQQRTMLVDVARIVFGVPDLDPDALAPIGPAEVAECFDTVTVRRRLRMFLVLFMLCRHPLPAEQVVRVEAYVDALGGVDGDPGLVQARAMAGATILEITEDLQRAWNVSVDRMTEATLRDEYRSTEMASPELVARVLALRDLPRGTLGREYVEFYRVNGFALPGEEPGVPGFFLGHDMCHLIAGCGPQAHEEIALGAFLLAAHEDDVHWAYLLGVLAIFEYGAYAPSGFEAKVGTLGRPGAMGVVLDAMLRGQQCYVDLLAVDHLAMAHLPIAEIRRRFNIAEPDPPFPAIVDVA